MAEFPALPLWTDAYLADCSHLSDAEHGRYLLLLITIWRAPQCRIPNDDTWLARKFGRDLFGVQSEIRPLIREFCDCTGNWITQKRLEKERDFLTNQSEKQGRRGARRWDTDRARANAVIRSQRMAEARSKGTHTKAEWEALRDIIGCCARCGRTDMNLEKDHIVPIYQGGSDAIENIQPSCAPCNAQKGAEAIDKRAQFCADWRTQFESVCHKLLFQIEQNASQNVRTGTRPVSAPTPTPTPIKKDTLSAVPADFEVFWQSYPREKNMSKKRALMAWKKLTPEKRIRAAAAVSGYRRYCEKEKSWYHTIHAERFLSHEKFEGFESETVQTPEEIEIAKDRADRLMRRGKYAVDYQ